MYNQEQTLAVDRNHIWHPFTQMKDYEDYDPKVISRAKGLQLTDINGNQYDDTISSWWTNIHGHSHPEINRAIRKQLKRLDHVNFSGFTHPYAAELVDRLSKHLPETLSRFFFSDDGSTAVEVALKIAFQFWQNTGNRDKTRFVFLENSYHGDTMGAVSVGGVELYHQLYHPLMFQSFKAAAPVCPTCPHRKSEFTLDASNTGCSLQCFHSLEKTLREHHQQTAAVIIEPLIQCAGGMFVYPKEYLARLRSLCNELNVLLILDEVATGFGRTGSMFAFQSVGITPDIICLSKGLTAGYMPLSLTITTETVYQAFYDDYSSHKTFFHGHSYTANPIACTVGIASLKLFDRRPAEKNAPVIKYFHKQLQEWSSQDFVSDIRYCGFIGAIDMVKSRSRKESWPSEMRIGNRIYRESLENGLVLRPLGDTIYWFLPLIVKPKDIDRILNKSLQTVKKVIQSLSQLEAQQ